ncbi:hypothetical protein BDV12DRAFT_50473 [Aspergillus spectabilis]
MILIYKPSVNRSQNHKRGKTNHLFDNMQRTDMEKTLAVKMRALISALDAGSLQRDPATAVIDALADLLTTIFPFVLPRLHPDSPSVPRIAHDITTLLRTQLTPYTDPSPDQMNGASPTEPFWPDIRPREDDNSDNITQIEDTDGEDGEQQWGSMPISDMLATGLSPNDFDHFLGLFGDQPFDPLFVPPGPGPEIPNIPPISPSFPSPAAELDWVNSRASHILSPSENFSPETRDMVSVHTTDDYSAISVATTATVPRILEGIRLNLETHGVRQVYQSPEFPPASEFQLRWVKLTGSEATVLIRQTMDASSSIGIETINYFACKMTSIRPTDVSVCVFTQVHRLQRPQRRHLVLALDPPGVIDLQPEIGSVIHYKLSHAISDNGIHIACYVCGEVTRAIEDLLRAEGQIIPQWNIVSKQVDFVSDNVALALIWVTSHLLDQRDLSPLIPHNYQEQLAWELFADLKAAYSSSSLMQGNPRSSSFGTSSGSPKDFWLGYGMEHGFGDKLWSSIQQLAADPRNQQTTMTRGIQKASELLLMALHIASPTVLVEVKSCLSQVRSQGSRDYTDSAGGTFDAFICHTKNKRLSTIGLRLAVWKLHKMKAESTRDELVARILHERPSSASWGLPDIDEVVNHKKGRYWANLVDNAANGNPNILCLLPHTLAVDCHAFKVRINPTTYRDLPVSDCHVIGDLCTQFRPGIIPAIDAQLANILLYWKQPSEMYELETLCDVDIKQKKLFPLEFYKNVLRGVE